MNEDIAECGSYIGHRGNYHVVSVVLTCEIIIIIHYSYPYNNITCTTSYICTNIVWLCNPFSLRPSSCDVLITWYRCTIYDYHNTYRYLLQLYLMYYRSHIYRRTQDISTSTQRPIYPPIPTKRRLFGARNVQSHLFESVTYTIHLVPQD